MEVGKKRPVNRLVFSPTCQTMTSNRVSPTEIHPPSSLHHSGHEIMENVKVKP